MSLSKEHLQKIRQSALTAEQAATLGWSSQADGSLLIPYLKPDGSPETCHDGGAFSRFRLGEEELARRMDKWRREGGKKPGKYVSPPGNGCRLYHSALAIQAGNYEERLQDRFRPLRITEGELKTECAAVHDPARVTIGLGGVTSWQDRYDGGEESRPLVDWDEIPFDGREVRLCYDSDIDKPQVAAGLRGFAEFLQGKGALILIELLPHDLNGDRLGLDDLIHRHGSEAFHRIIAIARPAFEIKDKIRGEPEVIWAFKPEPRLSHHKAVMAWAVFKDAYAARLGSGLYQWSRTHWTSMDGRPPEPLNAPLHQWMDCMGWERRESSIFGSMRQELLARIQRTGWDPSQLLAFENGTLDTRDDTFTPAHRRDDRLTFAFPFAYEPGAACPRWHQFLQETIGDPEMICLLQAAFRWSLMPKDRDQPFRHELAFDVHGRRGTGKGTLLEALQAVCGNQRGVGVIKSAAFSDPNALHGLIGKRVAVDADASGRISDPGTFNNVVSNEPVETKKLYEDVSSERLGVVVWRFYNDQPGASGGGLEGMGRRIVTFRFNNVVSLPDRNLKATLISEAAGIFAWAWGMGEQVMDDTLSNAGQIKAIRQAAIDAAIEREPILRFLIETFPAGEKKITAADLFTKWKDWAQAEGHEPGSNTRFGREVKKISAVRLSEDSKSRAYEIQAMGDGVFDLARHLGMGEMPAEVQASVLNPPPAQTDLGTATPSGNGGGFNPPQGPNPPLNPPPSKPASFLGAGEQMEGMEGLNSKPCLNAKQVGDQGHAGRFSPKPSTPSTAPPPEVRDWLIRARRERPQAAAFTLALGLESAGMGRYGGKQVGAWIEQLDQRLAACPPSPGAPFSPGNLCMGRGHPSSSQVTAGQEAPATGQAPTV
jgi:P4 family phage/plasmid primase-like protien